MFESLSEGLQSAFKSLTGKGKLTEANMREGLDMVEQALLEADVSYSVVQDFMARVSEKALGQKVLGSLRPHEELIRIVHEELVNVLGPVDPSIPLKKGDVTKIMLCGLQGSGKTTTAAKLALLLKEQKAQPFLVAADLQRPAAIEQLRTLGEQIDVPVYSEPGEQDPVKVCKNGVAQAKAQHADIVILDTAGRLAIDEELMNQLKDIDREVQPDQVYLVVDGMTGQDAVKSADAFNKALSIDGAILTKLDGDARGGALLSVKHVTQVPIKFIGTGEHVDALEPFRPEGMAGRILQMGDIVAVAQEAHRLISEKEREDLEKRLASGQLTLEDFRGLLEKIAKPGLMQKMISLMPGMGQLKGLMEGANADGEIRTMIGVIDSMTKEERRNPKIIDAPRRNRIARGAGVPPSFVSTLIKQFQVLAPMMQMASSGSIRDRMAMMQQMQHAAAVDPSLSGLKVKKGTGKRLSPKEREKMRKQREKMLRKLKRKKK